MRDDLNLPEQDVYKLVRRYFSLNIDGVNCACI